MNRVPRGFTLIELLVVVVIVAILAGASMSSFGRAIEKSRLRDAEATLKSIYDAERAYRLDHHDPANNIGYGALANLVNNGYMSSPNTNGSDPDWVFSAPAPDVTIDTFTATAKRNGGGYSGTVTIDEKFKYPEDGKVTDSNYGGTHPLLDKA